jgi:flagellin-like protein
MKFSMNKKGISPIVATLLLLSFAISLGVVLMNFGRAQVELSAVCPINIGLTQQNLCFMNNQVTFSVQNGINTKIEGLIVNIIGTKKAETFELNDAIIAKAGTYEGKINYDKSVSGEIRQIKISPKIKLYDEHHICIEKAVTSTKVGDC